jgi:hypothetical protein
LEANYTKTTSILSLTIEKNSNLNMKLAGFEVQITSQSGQPFLEVLDHQTNDVYIVAEAGKIFEIRGFILPERRQCGKMYAFESKVDGRSTGTKKLLSDNGKRSHASMYGFLREGSQKGTTYDLFQFAAAPQDGNDLAQTLEFKEGRIVVRVHQVEAEYRKRKDYLKKPENREVKLPSLPEGKKFFFAPSLTTTSGGIINGSGLSKDKRHKGVR